MATDTSKPHPFETKENSLKRDRDIPVDFIVPVI
jgi:hypothetical protein